MTDSTTAGEELERRLLGLAERALDEARLNLMMSFRFFDVALWQMPHEAADIGTATATDGVHLLFNPVGVVRRYREDPNELARDYLHSILHCVFRQPFKTVRKDPEMWSRACDICVESLALEMCGERFSCVFDGQRREALSRIAGDVGMITPMKVYRRILEARENPRVLDDSCVFLEVLCDEARLLARDDHGMWRLSDREGSEDGQGGSSGETVAEDSYDREPEDGQGERGPGGETDAGDDDNPANTGDSSGEDDDAREQENEANSSGSASSEVGEDADGSRSSSGRDGDQGESGARGAYEEDDLPDDELERAREAWGRIARDVETDLETHSKQRGDGMGNMVSNLELANRSQVDYADFLRRFSTMAEDMILNDEEFDYIFYTYGLKHYGNMPLIEPLEYKETNRVREFVVVLDTSGSCSGELVRTFMTRTYEILHDSGQFGEQINVHIIQCDAEVQSDDKITSVEELKRFEEGFEIRGMGGTDFRPAFAYVDELLEQGEFEDLRGLVYFTDGWGVFPKKKPKYETAFVFLEEEGKTRRVPPWAMRVVLTQDDIEEL